MTEQAGLNPHGAGPDDAGELAAGGSDDRIDRHGESNCISSHVCPVPSRGLAMAPGERERAGASGPGFSQAFRAPLEAPRADRSGRACTRPRAPSRSTHSGIATPSAAGGGEGRGEARLHTAARETSGPDVTSRTYGIDRRGIVR